MTKLKINNFWPIVVILFALVLRLASEPTANVSFLIIAAYALFGRKHAIQAFALSWLFSMLNPGLAPEANMAALGRYVVLVGATSSVFFRSGILSRGFIITKPVLATFLLGLFFLMHSILFSAVLDVSILKAISWTLVTSTLLSAWGGLDSFERELVINQIFGCLIVVLILSIPLLGMTLGYLRNESGFQGILSHPQVFGVTVGLVGAWAASKMFSYVKPSWLLVVLVVMCVIFVILSQARTAGVAMFLGLFISSISVSMIAGRRFSEMLPGLRSRRLHIVIAMAIVIGIVGASFIVDRLSTYFIKGTESTSFVEAYDTSRGGLMRKMWDNIENKPFTGIGFGIASYPEEMIVERDPFLGLPVSAAIEKGVLPIAVIEELGLFGFFAVVLWLWMIVRLSSRGAGLKALSVVVVALLMNMGEFMFFSPSGMGMLILIFVTWAASTSTLRLGKISHA